MLSSIVAIATASTTPSSGCHNDRFVADAFMTSTPQTVAVLAFPDRPAAFPPTQAGQLLAKIDKIARYRRNPRSPEYMRRLAATELPHATVIDAASGLSDALRNARHIVLMWPDAIGFGWTPLEREVFRAKPAGATVSALTGRRRTFELTPLTLLGLRIRRVVERFWLGEALMAVGLLAISPFLVMWDYARGHR